MEPLLLAQKLVGEKFEKWQPHIMFDHGRDSYNRGMDALHQHDYERALRDFDQSYKATSRLKTKALFVLGQSRSPRAGEIIAKYARGGGNPDVQIKAVEYLGIYGTPQNKQVLSDVYGSSSDPALKRAVLRAYMIAKDK